MYILSGGDEIDGTNDEWGGKLWNGTDFVTDYETALEYDGATPPLGFQPFQLSVDAYYNDVYITWLTTDVDPVIRMRKRTFDPDDTEDYGSWDVYAPLNDAFENVHRTEASTVTMPSIVIDELYQDIYVWITWTDAYSVDHIGYLRKLGDSVWEDLESYDSSSSYDILASSYRRNVFHGVWNRTMSYSFIEDTDPSGNDQNIMYTFLNLSGALRGVDIIDFTITNMEGCGNWVYAGYDKYYEFELMFEIVDGFYINYTALQFSDGYHNLTVSYNLTDQEFVLENGEGYIVLQNGEYELVSSGAVSDYYNLTYLILFQESVYDAYDIDVDAQIVSGSETSEWIEIGTDYFNIYSQGGLSGYGETAGADGRIPGDQQWEIYAGGNYYPSDIFEEHWQSGGINPGIWEIFDYDSGVLVDIHLIEIVDDHAWYSPYSTPNSLRIRAGDDPYDPHVVGTYDAVETSLYYFQTYVWLGDNTTGYSTLKLRYIADDLSVDTDVCVMRFGYLADFDGVYFDNSTGTYYSGYNYDVGGYFEVGWHNITFAVDPNSNTWIPYFDGNSLGNTTFYQNYPPNRIQFMSIYGSASRDSRWDAIKVWRDFEGGVTGTAWAYSYFRKLQHLHFTLGFGTNDEGVFSFEDPDVNDQNGYIEIGMNVCSRQDTTDWYQQWKVRIAIADGLLNVDNNWVWLNISWFERDNLIKSEFLYCYYEGFQGNRDYFNLYVDLWFSNINSSRTIMGRLNSQYFGITNVVPNWLKFITFGYYQIWGDMKTEETFSYFQSPLYNTTGSIHPAREIYMMQPFVRVHRENPDGQYYNFQYYVRNHGLDFNHLPPTQEMIGIDEPPKTETVSLKGEQPNVFWQILGVMQEQVRGLFESMEWGGLGMWSTFVGFLDTVFAWTGNPNAVSDFLSFLDNAWEWLTTGLGWLTTLIVDFFRLGAVTMTTGLELFDIFVTNWISIIQYTTSILGDGLQTGFNFWEDFQMSTWLQLVAIMYVVWLYFLGVHSGWDSVMTHLTFMMNVLSFVFTIIIRIAEFVISIVSLIIESIPVVE